MKDRVLIFLRELQAWISYMSYLDRFYPGSIPRILRIFSGNSQLDDLLEAIREIQDLPIPYLNIDPEGELIHSLQELEEDITARLEEPEEIMQQDQKLLFLLGL